MNDAWRRIIVDSRYRHKDSLTNSSFFVDLPYPVLIKKGSRIFCDDITFSHTWGTVSAVNDKLYVRERLPVTASDAFTQYNRVITLTTDNYDIITLAAELQTKLNNGTYLPSPYVVSQADGKLTVSNATASTAGSAKIYSRRELLDKDQAYIASDFADALGAGVSLRTFREQWAYVPAAGGSSDTLPTDGFNDATELIGLINAQPVLTSGVTAVLGHVDLQRYKSLYLCSPNLAESTTRCGCGTSIQLSY